MDLKRRFLYRVQRLFVYWGLLEHPYGREYAKDRYTPLGNYSDGPPANERT